MKKVFRTVSIYIILSMIACIVIGFLRKTPMLLSKDISLYKLYTGLHFFFLSIPALCISGFLVGCAIEFDEHSASCDYSFSREIFDCFKHVIKTSLVLVFIITASTEIAVPYFSARKSQMETNYDLFSEYMDYGQKYLDASNVELAYQYASRAVLIDKFSNQAANLKSKIEYAYENAEHLKNYALGLDGLIDDNFSNNDDISYTVAELMAKSNEATKKEEWLNAHYYAELAASISGSKDAETKETAINTAAEAWEELEKPRYFEKDEEAIIYSKKIEGYEALRRGNAIKAYYIFHTLSKRSRSLSNDPDIKQYLAASEQMLVKNYFFLDETDGIEHLEDARNVYFSIKQESGESSVYHIQGIASLKKRNQYVKYLRGLSIYNFDKSGNLSSSMKVPYAKLIGVPSYSVEAADENIYKYKTVPFVLLKSIDRDTEGVFTKPVYTYEENSEKRDEAESMVLPMPLSDFNLISDASVGPDKMFLPSLLNFVNKCSNYGFSMEVFRQTLIKRISFPMFILIILVMSAVFAWNYRTDCRLTFHFKWFFVLPVLSFLIYEFLNTIEYILVLLSYMFVGLFGVEAIFVCIIVYIVLFLIACEQFLSRCNH